MDLNQSFMELSQKKDKNGPYKIGLFGTAQVGKSALISRYIFKNYRQDYIPTFEDNFCATAKVDGIESDLEILDTPGSEEAFYNLFIKD